MKYIIISFMVFCSLSGKGQAKSIDSSRYYFSKAATHFYMVSSPKSKVQYVSQSGRPEYPAGNFYGIDSSGSTIFRWKDNSDTIYVKAGVRIIRLPEKY